MAAQNIYISSYFHLNPNCAVAYGFDRTPSNYIDTVYTHYVQKYIKILHNRKKCVCKDNIQNSPRARMCCSSV
jgi:hypothetical protein